jgi:hypothetical protein
MLEEDFSLTREEAAKHRSCPQNHFFSGFSYSARERSRSSRRCSLSALHEEWTLLEALNGNR